ncbi:hypothetical protein BDZ85DRAFT_282631 [Elsinoe ampelina]|uniref:BZIP domain-containing protein n=1 Tax=Elsinoe ampelina TaxID=302913 RepID=A0A6A6G9Y6_9PEZI|nr:hypothetical protein BDZ85DRAFT_282631 [Elsinoe ampelina]
MSSKLTDAERNRLKQQRSRARRKEYLTDLEDRLRTYERQGVQASVEVQSAARHVVAENQALRKLLAQHGAQPAEIEAFVKSQLEASKSTTQPEHIAKPKSTSQARSHQQLATPTLSPTQRSPPAQTVAPNLEMNAESAEIAIATTNRNGVYTDHISCEEAAQVIASMRGAANASEIFPELGCSQSQKCMVKSSIVFELS